MKKLIYRLFEKFAVPENTGTDLGSLKKILVVRQHNQLGDVLAGVPLFRALKEHYPDSELTVIASPLNYHAIIKNKFIDRLFVFDKSELYKLTYHSKLKSLLQDGYDAVIVPVTVSISFTSNLLARIAKAKTRIGPLILDGKENESSYFFDRRVLIDWRKFPDQNIYERSIDIVQPYGISTDNFRSEISFDKEDLAAADEFIQTLKLSPGDKLIGLHIGAGKPQNRWSLFKYMSLMHKLSQAYKVKFYLTGSSKDKEELDFVKQKLTIPVGYFIDRKIPEVAALISKSDLFISNDTGIMHVAGATETPQVSIFGPTNPLVWAPLGPNKRIVKKSDLIDEVTVEDVIENCFSLLNK